MYFRYLKYIRYLKYLRYLKFLRYHNYLSSTSNILNNESALDIASIKRVTIESNNFNTQDKILSISDIPRISDLPDSNQVYSIDYFVHLNLVYLITGFS